MGLTSFLVVACFLLAACVVRSDAAAAPLNYKNWKKALFISAHPDDIEASAGGLISELTQVQNTEVFYIIVTNGDKGCGNPMCMNWTSPQIAVARFQEALNAAKVSGVEAKNVFQLNYEDCMVTSYPTVELREVLVKLIRAIQPDVIMTWYPYPDFKLQPSQGWDDLGFHPDHQAVGRLALDSWFSAGVGLVFPYSGPSWAAPEFYLWEFSAPTHYYPLQKWNLNSKIEAYQQHKTQYPNATLVQTSLTLLAEMVAENAGYPGNIAEGFIAYY